MEQIPTFTGLAEIAGVFVGFGALISVTRHSSIDPFEHGLVRGCVTAGLLAMAGALFPVGVAQYGLEGYALWVSCAVPFLAVDWLIIVVMNRTPATREFLRTAARAAPWLNRSFWLLEVGLQIPLVLVIVGAFRDFEAALYLTAVLFSVFQAGYVLGMLVQLQRSALPSLGES